MGLYHIILYPVFFFSIPTHKTRFELDVFSFQKFFFADSLNSELMANYSSYSTNTVKTKLKCMSNRLQKEINSWTILTLPLLKVSSQSVKFYSSYCAGTTNLGKKKKKQVSLHVLVCKTGRYLQKLKYIIHAQQLNSFSMQFQNIECHSWKNSFSFKNEYIPYS